MTYYYDGQRCIEEPNGSDQSIKQYVWGTQYVDELVQVRVNTNPGVDDDVLTTGTQDYCETFYFPMHDANYNIIGLVDSQNNLVERYEYTPYGQRTIYKSAGTDDPDCYSPVLESTRVQVSGLDQPYGLCDIGHQGLMHDKEFGLINNRARYLHPTLGRFTQRDPLGYVDGMNLYEYVKSNPVRYTDWSGRFVFCPRCGSQIVGGICPVCRDDLAPNPTPKPKAKPNISELEGLLKKKCNSKKCCSGCSKTKCAAEAKKITTALQNLINREYGKGKEPWYSWDSRGGYMCWDWADMFYKTVKKIKSKCFQMFMDSAQGQRKPNGNTPVHYWLRIEAGGTPDESIYSSVAVKHRNKCAVAVDDGWINRGNSKDWVHAFPLTDYLKGKEYYPNTSSPSPPH